jgi:3'-5' exoribonuclease
MCRNYPQIDRDLLLTGVFLHDIGKIYELTYSRSFAYTTRGQLLGHMIIELELLQQKIAQVPGFPPELKVLLEHLIISHHGHYEFGSPKLPMFPEALMLHYLDDLDSKMESMRAHLEREADLDSPWTGYNASLGRPFLKRDKFLEKSSAPDDAEIPVPPVTGEIQAVDVEQKTTPLPFEPVPENGAGKAAAATAAGTVPANEPKGPA